MTALNERRVVQNQRKVFYLIFIQCIKLQNVNDLYDIALAHKAY